MTDDRRQPDPERDPQVPAESDALANLNASPLNRLPAVVWLLLLVLVGIEAVLQLAALGIVGGAQGIGWRIEAIQRYGYSSSIQDWMLRNGVYSPLHLVRYVTFSFIHISLLHALFAVVLIAALGKAVAEAFGAVRFLVLALVVPAVAAVIFGQAVGTVQNGWVIGAMPMAFALVGGFTWLKWEQAAGDPGKQRRAFAMIGLLLVARLAFGLIAEAGPGWIAEVAAFAVGFGLSATLLGPGRWQALRARLLKRG